MNFNCCELSRRRPAVLLSQAHAALDPPILMHPKLPRHCPLKQSTPSRKSHSGLCQVQSVTPGEAVTFTPASWLRKAGFVPGPCSRMCELVYLCSHNRNSVTPKPRARMLCLGHAFQSCPMETNPSIATSHQTFITRDEEKYMSLVHWRK